MLTKVCIVKAVVFPVVMNGCESWTIKKAECQRIDTFYVGLEKTLQSLLDRKEIKPVSPRGNQPWVCIRRTDAEVEAPILWPPDAKSQLTGKDSDAGKDWRQKKNRATADEIVDGISNSTDMSLSKLQEMVKEGSLSCCNPYGRKESDMTSQLNNKQHNYKYFTYFFILFLVLKRKLQASLVAQIVKNLHAVWETWVRSLAWEDLLQKEMAAHFSILAWKIPWTKEPGRLQSMGLQKELGTTWSLNNNNTGNTRWTQAQVK